MLLSIIPEQVCDLHCCSYCFHVLFGFFVFWSCVLCFVFPSLEFSVAGWRSVNLTLPFLNHENGDFSILMRDISYLKILSSSRFCNSEVSLLTLLCYCCWFQGLFGTNLLTLIHKEGWILRFSCTKIMFSPHISKK